MGAMEECARFWLKQEIESTYGVCMPLVYISLARGHAYNCWGMEI